MTEFQDRDRTVRIDRWLWAARFFKTRSQAATAIDNGKVHLNGNRAKRSKSVAVGDMVTVRKGPYEFQLEVHGLSERRGPAVEAAKLYQESEESQQERQRIADERALERAAAPTPVFRDSGGRPTKKDRRTIARFKRQQSKNS